MATLAKQYKISQSIGYFPITIKVTPRNYVVNIKGSTKFSFSYTAILASMIIAIACCFALSTPIRTTPFFMTALPITMVFALLPSGSAIIGTKATGILIAIKNVISYPNSFTTPFASKITMPSFRAAFPRATEHFISTGWDYIERGTTHFAIFIKACLLSLISAIVGTKTISTSPSMFKRRSADFTYMEWLTSYFTNTLNRTKSLRFVPRIKFFITVSTLFSRGYFLTTHYLPPEYLFYYTIGGYMGQTEVCRDENEF